MLEKSPPIYGWPTDSFWDIYNPWAGPCIAGIVIIGSMTLNLVVIGLLSLL